MNDFNKSYTFIEALSELYTFNPRKKTDSQIAFEITDKDSDSWLRFGKHYSKVSHKWQYFEHQKNCPCLGCEEKHFVSNIMTGSFAKEHMHYGAQQGTFEVRKVYDSRIDAQWH